MNPVNSTSALPTLSKEYRHANTSELQSFIESMGYTLFKQVVTRTKKVERRGYQKHMLIFDHPDLDLGGERIQLILVNSHDGSSSLRIMLGVYRLVCSNGLIVGKTVVERRITHTGDNFLVKVYGALTAVPQQAQNVINIIKKMQSTVLPDYAIQLLFNGIVAYRVGPDFDAVPSSFELRRAADAGNDLYTIYNRAQELLIRGGVKIVYKDGRVNGTRFTRKLSSIKSIVDANQFLWDEALKWVA